MDRCPPAWLACHIRSCRTGASSGPPRVEIHSTLHPLSAKQWIFLTLFRNVIANKTDSHYHFATCRMRTAMLGDAAEVRHTAGNRRWPACWQGREHAASRQQRRFQACPEQGQAMPGDCAAAPGCQTCPAERSAFLITITLTQRLAAAFNP